MTNSFYHHFHFSARRNHYQIKCTFSLLPPYAFHNYMYVHACMLSCFSRVRLIVTLWMPACQAPLSLGFSRHEYWSGLPCPPPGDLPNPGLNSCLLCLLPWQAGSLPLTPLGKPYICTCRHIKKKWKNYLKAWGPHGGGHHVRQRVHENTLVRLLRRGEITYLAPNWYGIVPPFSVPNLKHASVKSTSHIYEDIQTKQRAPKTQKKNK